MVWIVEESDELANGLVCVQSILQGQLHFSIGSKVLQTKLDFTFNVTHSTQPLANGKVSDGSQPPMTFDLSLSGSAGSRSLHRLVRCWALQVISAS